MGDRVAGQFWGYQSLGVNPVLWLQRGSCTTTPFSIATDGGSSATMMSAVLPQAFGTTFFDVECDLDNSFDPDIYEIDTAVTTKSSGFWRADQPTTFTAGMIEEPLTLRCTQGGFSHEGTWTHELGHGYGLNHFDFWLSSMNTAGMDFHACRAGQGVTRPSSDAQQGLRNHPFYTMPPGVDLSIYNVISGNSCPNVSAPGCKTRHFPVFPTEYRTVYPWDSSIETTVGYSMSNNRDSLPSGVVPEVHIFISNDETLDAGDSWIGGWSHTYTTFAGAVYWHVLPVTVAYSQLPPGRSCILAVVDPWNVISEVDETDNQILTGTCFSKVP